MGLSDAGFAAAGGAGALPAAGFTGAGLAVATGFAAAGFGAAGGGVAVFATGGFGVAGFGAAVFATGAFGVGGFGAAGPVARAAAFGLAVLGAAVRRCDVTCLAFAAGRGVALAAPATGRFFVEPLARAGAFMPDNSPAALPGRVAGTASCAPTCSGQTNSSAKDALGSPGPPLRRH